MNEALEKFLSDSNADEYPEMKSWLIAAFEAGEKHGILVAYQEGNSDGYQEGYERGYQAARKEWFLAEAHNRFRGQVGEPQ